MQHHQWQHHQWQPARRHQRVRRRALAHPPPPPALPGQLQQPAAPPRISSASTVQLTIVQDPPRFDMPLVLGGVRKLSRAAFLVSHAGAVHILTAATSVLHASQISLHVGGSRLRARVAHLCVEADLAVLHLASGGAAASEELAGAVAPLPLLPLPALQQRVQVRPVCGAVACLVLCGCCAPGCAARVLPPRPWPQWCQWHAAPLCVRWQVPRPSSSQGSEQGVQPASPGLVSRVEVVTYPCAKHKLLALQVGVAGMRCVASGSLTQT